MQATNFPRPILFGFAHSRFVRPYSRFFRRTDRSGSSSRHSSSATSMNDPPTDAIIKYRFLDREITSTIAVSVKTNKSKLVAALIPLLEHTSEAESQTIGSSCWYLDGANAEAINRHFAFHRQDDADRFVTVVMRDADDMDHHPKIARDTIENQPERTLHLVSIACGTHRPRGISMRDVRLAIKIDRLADEMGNAIGAGVNRALSLTSDEVIHMREMMNSNLRS